jgi:hypothetical protein
MFNRNKHALQNLGLILISLLIFLAATEVIMRVFFPPKGPRPDEFPQGIFCQRHPRYGWLGKPHASGTLSFNAKDMKDMQVEMNAEGFYDMPREKEKPSGVCRHLFLGDSFTIGYGTPRNDRFTDMIRQYLPKHHEVMNMGMWGYSTDQQLLVLKEKGLAYHPDIVILCMFVDDLYCNNLYSVNDGLYLKPRFRRTETEALTLCNVPINNNHTRSSLFNMVVSRYYTIQNRLTVGSNFHSKGWFAIFDRAYLAQDAYYLSLHLLTEIYTLAESNGARFLLVVIPWKDQLRADQIYAAGNGYAGIPPDRLDLTLPQKIVRRFCKEMEIPMLDLLDIYKKASKTEKLFFEKDLHWTQAGHRLAAVSIFDRLKELKYL